MPYNRLRESLKTFLCGHWPVGHRAV